MRAAATVSGRRWLPAAVVTALAAVACSGGSAHSRTLPPPPISSTSATASPTTSGSGDDATVWLCRPGHRPNPCLANLSTTYVLPDNTRRTVPQARPLGNSRATHADCFYVYPTVSGEQQANADLRIQAAERQVALVQAARFSAACDVWAPMYHQRTLGDLLNPIDGKPGSAANRTAFESMRAGWHAFLAAHDPARPIILIGHSQGAAMLIRLMRSDIDGNPAVRRQIALAILLGGNVTVASGRTTGGDFQHLPLCTKPGQTGCVIAYSSFAHQPPPAAFFGRPGQGVSLLSGNPRQAGLQVACVNPVSPGSTSSLGLHPFFPTALAKSGAAAPWTAYPGHATAQCRNANGATWLQVSPTAAGRDAAALVHERLGALWGFHDIDVNLALGDLVDDAAASAARWRRDH